MHSISTFAILAMAAISKTWASPVGASPVGSMNLTLFNGHHDVHGHFHMKPPTNERRSPLQAGDNVDCSGHSVLCTSLGGPTGECAAASRLIYNANIYSTTGNAGRTGVCSGQCGIFVSGSNCALTGAQLLDAYNNIHFYGCSDCGKVTLKENGCQIKMDWVSFC